MPTSLSDLYETNPLRRQHDCCCCLSSGSCSTGKKPDSFHQVHTQIDRCGAMQWAMPLRESDKRTWLTRAWRMAGRWTTTEGDERWWHEGGGARMVVAESERIEGVSKERSM